MGPVLRELCLVSQRWCMKGRLGGTDPSLGGAGPSSFICLISLKFFGSLLSIKCSLTAGLVEMTMSQKASVASPLGPL